LAEPDSVIGRWPRPQQGDALSARLTAMAFGQVSGPPASAKDVKELLNLLQDLGHSDFRDARGPMGLTQRQASGKFTRDEAAALAERLHAEKGDGSAPVPATPDAKAVAVAQALRRMPAEQLAAELTRRGWKVTAP
jgi:hypothetical protein